MKNYIRAFSCVAALSLWVFLTPAPVSAQFFGGGGDRGPGRGGRGGGDDFRARMLQRMDENGNGVLEPNEVSDRARGFIEGMARNAGLDPNRPMPLNRLSGSSSGFDRGRDRGGRGDRDNRRDRDRSNSSSNEDLYPIIARFGDPLVPGFGVNPLSLDGRIIDLEKKYDRRVLESVERTLSRYDKNNNGILDHDEWSGVSWRGRDPREADLDGDNRLTKAELAEMTAKRYEEERERDPRSRFAMFGRGGGPPGDRGGDRGDFGRRGGDRGDRGGRGRRGGDRGDDGGRGGGFGRGGFGRGGFDPSRMFARFDENGNGSIEPDEVDERARGMAERMGVDLSRPIRLDELSQRFSGRSGESSANNAEEEKKKAEEEAKKGQSYRIAGVDRFKGRKSYRSTGPELPKNLPSWWNRTDNNGDAQVSMSEFLATQSENSVSQFLDYDVNGDGVITAREAQFVASEK